MSTHTRIETPPLPGGMMVVCSALLFAGMALFAKSASRGISGAEVTFIRSVFGLLACAAAAPFYRFVLRNRMGLLGRGVAGGIAVYCYFLAIEHLPVGIATLLNYTAPVFTAVWSGFFLATRPDRRTLGALGLTTIGICFVLRGQAPPGALTISGYQLVGLLGAAMSGLAMAFIAEVRKTDGSWEIFGAFSLCTAIIAAPLAIAHWVTPTPRGWVLLIAMGSFSVAAQLLMTYAMRYVSATLSGVINQVTPVVSLGIGWFLFDEHFGSVTAIGIALTLVGGAYGAYLASAGRIRLAKPA